MFWKRSILLILFSKDWIHVNIWYFYYFYVQYVAAIIVVSNLKNHLSDLKLFKLSSESMPGEKKSVM